MVVGVHILGNLYGCPKELLEKVNTVRDIMRETASEADFHPVGETFHQFKPVGVTGVIVLTESHFSIHTWPEKNMAVVDIFTCGKEGNAEKGFDILRRRLQAEKAEKQIVRR